MVVLSDRFADAFTYANAVHRNQRRKRTEIPYVSHLLAVASIVLEPGETKMRRSRRSCTTLPKIRAAILSSIRFASASATALPRSSRAAPTLWKSNLGRKRSGALAKSAITTTLGKRPIHRCSW